MGQQVAVDTTSGGNAINITIIESGIGIASGNGNAGGDIQLLEVVSVLQVAAAIQLGAAHVVPHARRQDGSAGFARLAGRFGFLVLLEGGLVNVLRHARRSGEVGGLLPCLAILW